MRVSKGNRIFSPRANTVVYQPRSTPKEYTNTSSQSNARLILAGKPSARSSTNDALSLSRRDLLLQAGDCIKGGIAQGEMDEFGLNAVTKRVSVNDFHATILHLLSMDHEHLTVVHNNRDERLTDVSGKVIEAVIQ